MNKKYYKILTIMGVLSLFSACTTNHPQLKRENYVDIEQFMGAWFVIGYTPIIVDKVCLDHEP